MLRRVDWNVNCRQRWKIANVSLTVRYQKKKTKKSALTQVKKRDDRRTYCNRSYASRQWSGRGTGEPGVNERRTGKKVAKGNRVDPSGPYRIVTDRKRCWSYVVTLSTVLAYSYYFFFFLMERRSKDKTDVDGTDDVISRGVRLLRNGRRRRRRRRRPCVRAVSIYYTCVITLYTETITSTAQ